MKTIDGCILMVVHVLHVVCNSESVDENRIESVTIQMKALDIILVVDIISNSKLKYENQKCGPSKESS